MKKILIFLFILSFSRLFTYTEQLIEKNKNLPTVALITTGGTISETSDPKTHASIPNRAINLITDEMLKIANIKLIEFSNIDSSQMTPEIWASLSETVDAILQDNKIIGAVITHGTDSMAEGAFFLELSLKTKKPVVFTGAMRNYSDPFSDGPFNLFNALLQATINNDWGVTVTLNQYINAARAVTKTNTINLQTFESGQKGYLGYIFNKQVYKINDVSYHLKFPIPKKFPKIYIFQDYAGATGEELYFMIDQNPDAIVVEGLGSGNVNAQVFKALKKAIEKNIIVVITSVVPYGGVFPVYGDMGGGVILKDTGAIFSRFLRADKTRILLLLAIPHVGKNKEKLSKFLALP